MQWHPSEAWLLASGSFDRSVHVLDCRLGSVACSASNLPADVEALAWDPFRPQLLFVALEDGQVGVVDTKEAAKRAAAGEEGLGVILPYPIVSRHTLHSCGRHALGQVVFFRAHKGPVSSISFSPCVQGMLVT